MIDKEEDGFLMVDDTVLTKKHSEKIESVHDQYSGNAYDVIAGIGWVNLLWHKSDGSESVPDDDRIYDQDTDRKTKNTHFFDMLSLAKKLGLKPPAVFFDAWYSSPKNLEAIRDHGWIWITTLRKNRKVNRGIS